MTSTKKWVLVGAISAVVLVAAVVGALKLRPGTGAGGASSSAAPTKVVVVFAMAGEDQAQIAQLVAVVDAATGRCELQDTSSTVSIPGTSYTQLRDAYPFGGAEAVAAALGGGSVAAGTAWVDVSQEAWQRLLATGVDVTIKEPFQTFDDVAEHYSEFEVGAQHVAAADLRGLVNGVAYLGTDARSTILQGLAAASLRELASATPSHGIETDLTSEQWAGFAKALKGK